MCDYTNGEVVYRLSVNGKDEVVLFPVKFVDMAEKGIARLEKHNGKVSISHLDCVFKCEDDGKAALAMLLTGPTDDEANNAKCARLVERLKISL